jgi:hypothetical protein
VEDPFTSAYTQDDSDEDQPENMLIDMGCEPIEDIDASDRNDPTCCTEYVDEIFEYYHAREVCSHLYSKLHTPSPLIQSFAFDMHSHKNTFYAQFNMSE